MERPIFDGPLLKTSSSRFQLNAPFLQNTGVYTRIFENAAIFIRIVVVLRPHAIDRAMTASTCADVIQPCFAPGNIPLTDEFQSELNSDFLIGRKFPQLSFFRPIREPHTMQSDRDSLYQVINTTSMIAIFFLSLSLPGSQNRHTMRRKFGSQRDPQVAKFNQFYLEDFVTWGQLSVHV